VLRPTEVLTNCMNQLPVLNCDDCGACCLHVGNPPGYGGHVDGKGNWVWLTASLEDSERLQSMPAALQEELRRNKDRGLADQPCHWFDLATRQCVHYDQRPEACRMFEVGEDDCVSLRKHHGIENHR
jgi:Fe-S-cluster containining protein